MASRHYIGGDSHLYRLKTKGEAQITLKNSYYQTPRNRLSKSINIKSSRISKIKDRVAGGIQNIRNFDYDFKGRDKNKGLDHIIHRSLNKKQEVYKNFNLSSKKQKNLVPDIDKSTLPSTNNFEISKKGLKRPESCDCRLSLIKSDTKVSIKNIQKFRMVNSSNRLRIRTRSSGEHKIGRYENKKVMKKGVKLKNYSLRFSEERVVQVENLSSKILKKRSRDSLNSSSKFKSLKNPEIKKKSQK